MKTAKSKNSKKSFNWRIALLILTVFLLVMAFSKQYMRYCDIKDEVFTCTQELKEAQKEYQKIKKEKDLLDNDSYIEQKAREDLGMIKKGEVLVLPSAKKADSASQ